MPALSIGRKAWRGLKLLVRAQTRPRRSMPSHVLLTELGAWESRWFPVASSALRGRHPEIYEWLFRHRAPTEGASVVISVGTFLVRLETMASEPALGAGGARARQLLVQHGLSTDTLQVARQLLAALGATSAAQSASLVRSRSPEDGREGMHSAADGEL